MSVTKKNVLCAVLVACGLILGYVENMFPPVIPLYGLKIGFSNLVVIYSLYILNTKRALAIGVIKAVLCGLLFSGLMSIAYSMLGIIFSVFSMHTVKKFQNFMSEIGVSVIGSATFQVGQIVVACVFLKNIAPIYYLSYLLIGSVPCGIISGSIVRMIKNRIRNLKEVNNE